MALPLWALTFLGLTGLGLSLRARKPESFRSETELNHLVVDAASGVVYVGAVNALYQLSADLQVQQHVVTGPAMDNKKCTPPIEASQCHEAVLTDNVNQLLLLDPPGETPGGVRQPLQGHLRPACHEQYLGAPLLRGRQRREVLRGQQR